jgi:hypothetical protein
LFWSKIGYFFHPFSTDYKFASKQQHKEPKILDTNIPLLAESALKEPCVFMADHVIGQLVFGEEEARAHGARNGGHFLLGVRMHGLIVDAQRLCSLEHFAALIARRELRAMHQLHVVFERVGRLGGVRAIGVGTQEGPAQVVRLHVAHQGQFCEQADAAHRAEEGTRPVGVVRFHVHQQACSRFETMRALRASVRQGTDLRTHKWVSDCSQLAKTPPETAQIK